MCWLMFFKKEKRKSQAGFAVEGGVDSLYFSALLWPSFKQWSCLVEIADGKRTPRYCGIVECRKLAMFLHLQDASISPVPWLPPLPVCLLVEVSVRSTDVLHQ